MTRLFVVLILLLISACSWHLPMTGENLRAALDECKQNDLDVLAYARTDNSIMAVRCIPKANQVAKTIRVRPYAPMKLIRSVTQMEEVIE